MGAYTCTVALSVYAHCNQVKADGFSLTHPQQCLHLVFVKLMKVDKAGQCKNEKEHQQIKMHWPQNQMQTHGFWIKALMACAVERVNRGLHSWQLALNGEGVSELIRRLLVQSTSGVKYLSCFLAKGRKKRERRERERLLGYLVRFLAAAFLIFFVSAKNSLPVSRSTFPSTFR